MNRLATVSVVKGLDAGEEGRIREGEGGATRRMFVEIDFGLATSSERRSLPIGS
jgi:hypothetical protein